MCNIQNDVDFISPLRDKTSIMYLSDDVLQEKCGHLHYKNVTFHQCILEKENPN